LDLLALLGKMVLRAKTVLMELLDLLGLRVKLVLLDLPGRVCQLVVLLVRFYLR
jgi:hypothetical protein